jgi:hypothetical protein
MSGILLAGVGALASYQIVLVTLVACIVLLCVRTWLGVMGIVLFRRVTVLLNISVIVLLTSFLLVVILRFKTLA